jgi:phospholipid-binding lipoprotein MlaA
MRRFALIASLLLMAGCATTPGSDGPGSERLAERDPLEGFNRGVWGFNQFADKVAIKPVSTVYRTVAPRPARRGLSRILANLSEPFSAVNNLLQGKPKRAVRNLGRFVVNSTIGVGGLADHATDLGIATANEDFGQTLATWGANGGPYLVLPLLGPSTLRDGVGRGVAFVADPYQIALRQGAKLSGTERLAVTAGTVISVRSDLTDSGADAFLKSSLDPYAAARSAYLQRRHAEVRDSEDAMNGGEEDVGALPDDPAVAAETIISEPVTAPVADAAPAI